MDPQTAQIVVGALGIGGTLAASLLTQLFARRTERERRLAEDQTRWLPNRLTIATELLNHAGHVYRTLYSAAAFLNAPEGTIQDRPKWLAGYMNVLSTPEEGLTGILSAEDREMLVDFQMKVTEALEEMENVVSQVVLLGSDEEGDSARVLYDLLWDAEGWLEMYAPGNLMFPTLADAKEAIETYTAVARAGLRVPTATQAAAALPLPGLPTVGTSESP